MGKRTFLEVQAEYQRWLEKVRDPEVTSELMTMDGHTELLQEAFYRDLSFGTGGLRGTLGAGTNHLNVYTVGKASQGLANYLKNQAGGTDTPSVVIGYDSRINSDLFAKVAARVFAANGLQVHFWQELLPVPTVSYAVRVLHASAGVMITASHNPSKYNGYKVYGADGCQITTEAAAAIYAEIDKVDPFEDVQHIKWDEALASRYVKMIDPQVLDAFIKEVEDQSVLYGDDCDRSATIIYSPLNGTGRLPVTRVLSDMGFENVVLVTEQEAPDGHFPTCPYPNPEVGEAMALGIEYAKRHDAELMLATDPDCDRVGIAVRHPVSGQYVLLSGNETGVLLLDYICGQRQKHGKMPADPVMCKTIVTTAMGEKVAESYGVSTINVLTGFKFIGEQIGYLESRGMENRYIFGMEESYGYLSGTYVRDKDGVNAAFLICEMFGYYYARGINLLDRLSSLYKQYGYFLNTQHAYDYEGAEGMEKMQSIMDGLRQLKVGNAIGGRLILKIRDYAEGLDGLPKSNVLKFTLEGDASVIVRPSGTEPKLKLYFSVSGEDRKIAVTCEEQISGEMETYLA